MTDRYWNTENLIEEVKRCALTVIRNAESIVGNAGEKKTINVYISLETDSEPSVWFSSDLVQNIPMNTFDGHYEQLELELPE